MNSFLPPNAETFFFFLLTSTETRLATSTTLIEQRAETQRQSTELFFKVGDAKQTATGATSLFKRLLPRVVGTQGVDQKNAAKVKVVFFQGSGGVVERQNKARF